MSPFYQKVFQTLTFLNLPFKTCIQPHMLPRPDLNSVGITYRRIPLLSIDNEMYADTAIIISKLCQIADVQNYKDAETFGKEAFNYGVGLLPAKFMQDENFVKDRADFAGRPFDPKMIAALRPATLSQFMALLHTLENNTLSSSNFVKGSKMTVADIHVGFVYQWVLMGHQGAEPECNNKIFPKTYAWLNRMAEANPPKKVEKISWEDAKKILLSSAQHENVIHNSKDPLGMQVGQPVSVTPTDTGRSHPQIGELVAINFEEVCIKVPGSGIRMHFPRFGFVVQKVKANL